ncbi:MAG: hypothetical protein J6Q94_03725 [Clostridia bacterium]|nr:hypothetical protein [Clostridia bacterium]
MANTKKYKIILILSVIVVITGVVAMCFFFKFNKDIFMLDGPGMEYDMTQEIFYCSYYNGGGMENTHISYELNVDENQVVTITYEKHDEEPITRTVSYDAIDEIRAIYRVTGALDWFDLPVEDIIVEDAPIKSVTVRFRDEILRIDNNHVLPKAGEGFMLKIYNVLKTYYDQGVE